MAKGIADEAHVGGYGVCGEPCPRHPDARCIVARVPPGLREARGAFRMVGADEPHPHMHAYVLRGGAGMVIHMWGRAERYAMRLRGRRFKACTQEEAERLIKMGVP